jgi:hypothetical protein
MDAIAQLAALAESQTRQARVYTNTTHAFLHVPWTEDPDSHDVIAYFRRGAADEPWILAEVTAHKRMERGHTAATLAEACALFERCMR